MKTESEIVQAIAEAQLRRNAITGDIESLTVSQIEADRDISRLKAELAEAKKPKLRHEDYGITTAGNPWIKIREDVFWLNEGSIESPTEMPLSYFSNTFGNLGDDLKAIQEPLEEFSIGWLNFKWDEDGELSLDGDSYIDPDDIAEFILNLRRMEATMKAKK